MLCQVEAFKAVSGEVFDVGFVIKHSRMVILQRGLISKIWCMNSKVFSLLLLALPGFACAMGNPCEEGLQGDEKLLCNAKRSISVNECDKGSSMEFRMFCVSAVRIRQRDHLYGVKPMTAANTKIITSSPMKYFWMN